VEQYGSKKNYYVVGAIVLFAIMMVMRLELLLLISFSSYFVMGIGYHYYCRVRSMCKKN